MENSTISTSSYLTFKLDQESFALHVSKVLEILEVTQITKVPQSPDYMRGVVNLRGNVLPVIDTRAKFGLSSAEFTVDTCIVVLDITSNEGAVTLGALVDSVQEVAEISNDQVQPPPKIGNKYNAEFINGMVKREEGFTMLLDIDKVFTTDEITFLRESGETLPTD